MIYILPTDTCFGIACAFHDTNSYHRIYEIKKRSFDKPLAIMVESFEWLSEHTDLTDEQIGFLKNYPRPFTILTTSPHLQMVLQLDQEDFYYENREIYSQVALRVAHNDIQKNLIEEIGPIFLTSANISGQNEIYNISEAKKQFSLYDDVIYLGEDITLDSSIPPSDIFSFLGESVDISYIRQ